MSLNFCDLLIVGSDLSGILAGTLLAKRGLSVLVLEEEESEEIQPNVLSGLESRLFKSILGKLTIPEGRLNILKKNQVSSQVILPRHRLDVSDDMERLFKEIRREFPTQLAPFESIVQQGDLFRKQGLEILSSLLPIDDKKEKKKFIKLTKTLPIDSLNEFYEKGPPELKAFLMAQILFLTGGVQMDPLAFQTLFLLSPESLTTYSVNGGLPALKKIFFEKIEYFGGSIQKAQEGYEIVAKKREVKGVKLAQYRYVTRCRYLLANTHIQNFYQAVPKTWRTRSAKKKASRLSPEGTHFTVCYSIDGKNLPSRLRENAILIQDPAQPLRGLNYLQVNCQETPATVRADGDTVLTVTYRLPTAEAQKTVTELESMHEEITARLHKLIPFAKDSLKRVFPVVSAEDDSLFPESSEDYALFRKESKGRHWYNPSFFYPTLSSPYDNCFTVGPDLLSWLGMEGKVMAAMRAVDKIWEQEIKTRNP